jgi:hypothetical protein
MNDEVHICHYSGMEGQTGRKIFPGRKIFVDYDVKNVTIPKLK